MLDKKLFKQIKVITIPEYIYQVQTSKSRLTKYFHAKTGRDKVKKDILEIPKKYKAIGYDLEGYVITAENQRIIANPLAAGTSKYVPINGQIFYSQNGGQFTRVKIVNALHEFYKEALEGIQPFVSQDYPIVMVVNWFCPYSHKTLDNTNFAAVYIKTFEDVLTNMGIIRDDEVKYVTGSFPIYTPVEDFEHRKIIFTFYQDLRAEVQQFKLKL